MVQFNVNLPNSNSAADAFRDATKAIQKIVTDLQTCEAPMVQEWLNEATVEQYNQRRANWNTLIADMESDLNLKANKLDDITENYRRTDKSVAGNY